MFRRLEDLSGFRLYLVTASGRSLLDDVPVPPSALIEAHLPRESGKPPSSIPGRFVISIPIGDRTAGYLFAMERQDANPAGLTAAQHIATVTMLELADRYRSREIIRREGAETLAELLSGSLDPEAACKRLSLAGFDPETPLVLLAMGGDVDAVTLLEAWSELGVPHLLIEQRELYALIPSDAEALRASGTIEASGPERADRSRSRPDSPWHVRRPGGHCSVRSSRGSH